MHPPGDRRLRTQQYATDARLSARLALHQRFSTSAEPWHAWLFRTLALRDGQRVLDLGCGNAALWRANRPHLPALRAVLCDFSRGMLDAARESTRGAPGEIATVQADASAPRLPFADGAFDVVMAHHMLYHVADAAHTAAELRRVLDPAGTLYAATNGASYMRELFQVVESLGLHIPGAHAPHFDLSSGPAKIGRSFAEVSVARYPNRLEVDDAQAALAYVRSACELSPDRERALLAAVEREIRERGHFGISSEVGVIVARGRAG